MSKRVYDMSGVIGGNVKVFLNNRRLPIKGFQQYTDLYLTSKQTIGQEIIKVTDNKGMNNERWEVIVSLSDGQF
jgi:DNA topoisomerase-2